MSRPAPIRGPHLTLSLAMLLSLGLAACGNAVGSGGQDSTTGDSAAGDAAAGDAATGDSAGGGGGIQSYYPSGADKCQNSADLGWLKEDQGGGETGRDVARAAAGDCGLGCLNHPAPDQCAINCMLKNKGVKLSDACAGCYGGIVLCTINLCLPKCIDDAQSKGCKDCQEDKGCNDPFYACTGNLD